MKNYDRLMSHDLVVLSYNHCSEEAAELQRITGRAERMRYPDNWCAPHIPHTQYDAGKARRAIECALKIVEYVEHIVN